MRKSDHYYAQIYNYLDKQGKTFNLGVGLMCAIILAALDVMAPPAYSFAFLYLFPILCTTWFVGKRGGFLISILCTFAWSKAYQQEELLVVAWNVISTLGIFGMVTMMIAKIRTMWESEKLISRTDPLTRVMNRRAFEETVEIELLKHRDMESRFSFAYIDLDNFKRINDRHGHKKGDDLLKAVVQCLVENLRRTDLIARIGGDEFVVFFPETDQDSVKLVMQKIRLQLYLLSERNNWPVTFSIGVLTCANCTLKLEELISHADKLMFEVKYAGKNDIRYENFPYASMDVPD